MVGAKAQVQAEGQRTQSYRDRERNNGSGSGRGRDRNRNMDSGNGSGSGVYLSEIGLEERHVQEHRQTGHVATPHWQECKLIILRHTVSNILQDEKSYMYFLSHCLFATV